MSLNHLTSMAIINKTQVLTLHSNASDYLKYHAKDYAFGYLDEFELKHAKHVTDARNFLKNQVGKDSLKALKLVDTMKRLCIDNHFQDEIQSFLRCQYLTTIHDNLRVHQYKDLSEISLCFRLLRQEGYHVPPDHVFGKFKDEDGSFKEIIREDVNGLMDLYEASQLRIKGEDILDEAERFSNNLLNEKMGFLDQYKARTVRNTLMHPFHKSLARFTGKHLLPDLNGKYGYEKALQELAQFDYSLLQSIYQGELLQISRWWKELGLTEELKFARDQPVKWHMWPMAMLTDPCLSKERIELTKPISLIYIIDDIFDIYGTVDELTLFTEAVNRWELSAVDQLPDYMKKCFKTLYEITNEIGYKIYKKHGRSPVDFLRRTWANLCNAFLVEAKWFASGRLPLADEYLKNGIVSSGVHVVLVHLYFLLGDGASKERANFLIGDNPGIISSVAAILRLWDDLGSAKDENQEGNDGSYIECYLKEHQGASIEIAREHVINKISEEWKCLNKECFSTTNLYSTTFIQGSLNLARMVPLMYSYNESQQFQLLEEYIKSILYDTTFVNIL